jgi:hypothetical protein
MAKWFNKDKNKLELQPGEFEVLTTSAQRAWWENGRLVITNYRVFWYATMKTAQTAPTIEIEMEKILGCVETRSWYHLLTKPALRILLNSGKSIDFHDVKDFGGVKANIERFMGRERYVPGSLFNS